ncbi:hypothetical protein QE152_g35784 [Popillia japonica]|uniref:Uncharacterized protein n=1 Tax=Popillia japonica TaxID=7064 RepID=A0AAW1IF80_POPJA
MQENWNKERKELKEIISMQENWNKERKELKNELYETKEEVESLKREKIRNNLVITGITVETEDMNQINNEIGKTLENEMNIKVIPRKAFKIKENIWKLEMNTWEEKMLVLKEKGKLRSNIEMSVDGKGSNRKRAKLAREAIGGKNDRDSNSREVWDTQQNRINKLNEIESNGNNTKMNEEVVKGERSDSKTEKIINVENRGWHTREEEIGIGIWNINTLTGKDVEIIEEMESIPERRR